MALDSKAIHSNGPLRRVVILGATGSIGQSALRVARALPNRIQVVGLSAHSNSDGLIAAAKEFRDAHVACSKGPDGGRRLIELATLPEADVVLIAIVGTAGLKPALAAIEAGKDIAIASKEILVMAGQLIMNAARRKGVQVLPIDSEHNAIFQCLQGSRTREVRRLILTCSGGPFRNLPESELPAVTPQRALRHPTWQMGKKITIDSASLFNKGLEMIEAKWLFGVPMERIDAIIHPQSIVHSIVEFVDGSQLAQLSQSDMAFPIQYALTYPDRVPGTLAPLNLAEIRSLEFSAPRTDVFPALRLAKEAGRICGTLPAVLNAANEVAAQAFIDGKIPFPAIWKAVETTMATHDPVPSPDLEMLLEADAWARAYCGGFLEATYR